MKKVCSIHGKNKIKLQFYYFVFMHTNQLSNTNNQQWTRIGSRKKNRTKPSEQENYLKKKNLT